MKLSAESPWVPDLVVDLAAWNLASKDAAIQDPLLRQLIMDPGAGRELYLLGSVLQGSGRVEEAQMAWNGSLKVSERFRPSILERAVTGADPTAAFQKFGPESYAGCIECAEQMRKAPVFKEQLLSRAEQLWPEAQNRLEPKIAVLRGRQFILMEQLAQADEWLRQVQGQWPTSNEIRAERARCLEALDRIDEAHEEWFIIKTLDPENEIAAASMKRLANLPPKLRKVKR
ncbi:MAG: hypothetical protein JNM43_01700 [Planctomycetaceae bacterium]|nr:hypothetical protein [Planctomycetaceae bacterium]